MATRLLLAFVALFCLFFLASNSPQAPDAAPSGPVVDTPSYPNKFCPIMGKPVSARLFVDTAKGRFWVCCKSCYEEILADLEVAHQAAYPQVVALKLKVCPVTDAPLPEQPYRVVVQGFDVPLCCKACEPDLLRDSQIHLALLANPKLVDLRNPRCPITNEAVTANNFCTIDGVLVRLSSMRVLEELKADAAKALAKARASVAEFGALPRPKRPAPGEQKPSSGEGKRPEEKQEHAR